MPKTVMPAISGAFDELSPVQRRKARAEDTLHAMTLDQLVDDLVKLLKAKNAEDLHPATVRYVVRGAVFKASNHKGRTHRSPFRSAKAHALIEASGYGNGDEKLVMDHVVPRILIEREILKLKRPTRKSVKSLLDLSVNCLIAKSEDDDLRKKGLRERMPDGWSGENLWARYDAAGIERWSGRGD